METGTFVTTPSFSEQIQQRLQEIEAAGLLRRRRIVEPLGAGLCRIGNQTLRDFSSNDYLGLSTHPQVTAATAQAVTRYGVGARASMLISGWSPVHQGLREALARFEQAEDAMLFPSGYTACMGTVSTLVDAGDLVFCDKLNHACLVDGCRLSGARLRVYRHDQLETLERELKKSQFPTGEWTGRRWIITETLFGMDGTQAALPELLQLAETYNADLICDEAHATGVYGPGGRGLIAALKEQQPALTEVIQRRVVARMGTLSKSLGSQGGFVVGSQNLVALLWNTARPAMFSTGLSLANCAAATAAIQLLETTPEFSSRLRSLSQQFRQRLKEAGLQVLGADDCPILPLVIEDPVRTLEWAGKLEAAGFLVGAVRPPTVPKNTSRLRISLSLSHSSEVLEPLLTCLSHLQQESAAV